MLSEIQHSEKDKYHVISLYVVFKKHNKEKKRQIKNRFLSTENKLMVIRVKVGKGMGEIGEGD